MALRAIICSFVVLLGTSAPVSATPELMQKLPVSGRFKCLICHESEQPIAADLNAFGTAFKANGSLWNVQLAQSSSDTDGCTNGFELGDENGDGKLDNASLVSERFNPGDDDCELQITDTAWGALKQLFQ